MKITSTPSDINMTAYEHTNASPLHVSLRWLFQSARKGRQQQQQQQPQQQPSTMDHQPSTINHQPSAALSMKKTSQKIEQPSTHLRIT